MLSGCCKDESRIDEICCGYGWSDHRVTITNLQCQKVNGQYRCVWTEFRGHWDYYTYMLFAWYSDLIAEVTFNEYK